METVYDKDLKSIQEARTLAERSYRAQQKFLHFNQQQVDEICETMVEAGYRESEHLGRMAAEDTGYGNSMHKMLKNQLNTTKLWERIKDLKTVGIIREDKKMGIQEVAWPMGVVAALTPVTNPTSTAFSNIINAVKTRNGIVIAPHPFAVKCTCETVDVLTKAGEGAGMPAGLIGAMTLITIPGTHELLRHKRTSLILATGGGDMVKMAHSMGKPTYGVGPGNTPVYVDRSADASDAAYNIVSSKAFDCSLICSTEQSVVVDRPIADQLKSEMKRFGAYFVNPEQADALRKVLFLPNGAINTDAVGKTPQMLASLANISIPDSAKILVTPITKVGKDEFLSLEKLTTVLGWYEVDGWEAGCERCLEIIYNGGQGHTLVIHAKDKDIINAFALEKPVFRMIVNTMGTLGAAGGTTGVTPSMTLGPGGIGGAITGDNIGAKHLMNIKRVACKIEDPPSQAMVDYDLSSVPSPQITTNGGQREDIEKTVEKILRRVLQETKT